MFSPSQIASMASRCLVRLLAASFVDRHLLYPITAPVAILLVSLVGGWEALLTFSNSSSTASAVSSCFFLQPSALGQTPWGFPVPTNRSENGGPQVVYCVGLLGLP